MNIHELLDYRKCAYSKDKNHSLMPINTDNGSVIEVMCEKCFRFFDINKIRME